MAAGHGAIMFHPDVLSACCAQRASSSNDGAASGSSGAAAVKFTMTARIGMRSSFGCSGADAAAVSSTSSRQIQVMTSRSSRSSSRQEALRPRQSYVVGEEEAEEEVASFWDRLQKAWRVLIGSSTEAQATKKRFSRLLVRDRGFNSVNLSRLCNAAKGAIQQHVELEGDEDTEVTTVINRLGELRLDFRVKRVKSVLMDEPFSHSVIPDIERNLSISGHQLWENNRAPQDSDVHSFLPNMEPNWSSDKDQLWEGGLPNRESFANSALSDVEPRPLISGDLSEDSNTAHKPHIRVGRASNLVSTTDVDTDGVWYTFSFIDGKVVQET